MNLPTDTMPCKPIWIAGAGFNDEYADFYPVAALLPGHSYKLRIAADTDYNVFVDGVLIGFGQYSDNPDRLIYDDYGISVPESRDTPSALKITAWHSGIDSQCHIKHPAYVAFALFENGKPVPGGCSDENTPSSFNPSYIQRRCRSITSQLGAGFGTVSPMRTKAIPEAALGHGGFAAKPQGASVSAAESSLSGSASDNNRELFGCSDSQEGFKKCLFSSSSVTQLELSAVLPRPNRRLVFDEKITGTAVRTGFFRADAALSDDPGKLMTEAVLTDVSLSAGNAEAVSCKADCIAPLCTDSSEKMPGESIEGSFYVFDLGEETVGYPEISFESDEEACMFVGWGEHLTDGICRTVIGGRRFAFDYFGHRGQNLLFPSFRRLGCRYIQLFISGNPKLVSLSFRPVIYPAQVLPADFDTSGERGALRERIRNTAIHTLRCCMHEHYEDCPWREQSLYTLDSRNQMLAGYRVFADGNREMVRSSLDLMSRGIRPDGIMQLCFPAGKDYPIPFYSLAWFVQFDEYLNFTDDTEFAAEKLPVLRGLMDSILSRMITDGEFASLCPRYPESRKIWNFYEWSDSMSGAN
ncbi:MAG: hypothetical protein MJ137_04460, partial [Clostridia bacterium]|nr:hypothetical protein [Clostridia bacterium]